MSSTYTVTNALNWASLFIRSAPLTGVNSVANEPGLSICNWVKNLIMAPPFSWRWNRATTTFTTTAGTQDYTQSLSTFGWLEKASITDSNNNVIEIDIALDLGEDSNRQQPNRIAARIDNDAGSITFRLMPVPDQTYTVTLTYQNQSSQITSTSSTFTPIPDYMQHVLYTGVLAKVYEYINDDRWMPTMQLFLKTLVAWNGGLSETEANLFVKSKLGTAYQENSKMATAGSGRYK